jgi:hypothetical protein
LAEKIARTATGSSLLHFALQPSGVCFSVTFLSLYFDFISQPDIMPGYLFQALSYFTWVCWIAPDNVKVNQLFGYRSGLGMSLLTFDWNQIAYIVSCYHLLLSEAFVDTGSRALVSTASISQMHAINKPCKLALATPCKCMKCGKELDLIFA